MFLAAFTVLCNIPLFWCPNTYVPTTNQPGFIQLILAHPTPHLQTCSSRYLTRASYTSLPILTAVGKWMLVPCRGWALHLSSQPSKQHWQSVYEFSRVFWFTFLLPGQVLFRHVLLDHSCFLLDLVSFPSLPSPTPSRKKSWSHWGQQKPVQRLLRTWSHTTATALPANRKM